MILVPLDRNSVEDRQKLVKFANDHYLSEIPLEESTITSGKIHFFWAKMKHTNEVIGITGYMAKTRFLAETVKTVVDPKYRGKGLGEKLSQAIEDEVRQRGFTKVMTTIYIDNLPMIFIKLKQGYRFEGFHPNHEKPGLHEYSFGKVLS